MARPNPFGPPNLTDYPTVRIAVRIWAIKECLSYLVSGLIILAFAVVVLVQVLEPAPPTPPPRPTLLVLRENWASRDPQPHDDPHTLWFKSVPPPAGWAYTDDYRMRVKLPGGLKPPPKGYTYTTKDFRLVPIPPEWGREEQR